MSAKTRIIVLKKRECIYTAIFLALGITLLVLLVLMFMSGGQTAGNNPPGNLYVPGIYTTPITLNQTAMNLEVRVSRDTIDDICLANVSETVSSMFPLVEPSLDQIADQVLKSQSTENIFYEEKNQYTSQMLLNAIGEALRLARK